MCREPDFVLPESFIKVMREFETRGADRGLAVKLSIDTTALVEKITEQTGYATNTVATALLEEGIKTCRTKGILF